MTISQPFVIGINGSFHDASVCVLSTETDEPVLLLSEDRHSGISHHFGFPFETLSLAIETVGAANIAAVGYSRDRACYRTPPEGYFADLLNPTDNKALRDSMDDLFAGIETHFPDFDFLRDAVDGLIREFGKGDPTDLRKRLCYLLVRYANEMNTEANIRRFLPDVPITGIRHHDTHAATYFASPFESAAVITWDGRGEFDSTVLTHGKEDTLTRAATVSHPLSLGTFYEIFADYIGLGRIEGPGKLMGLAAYGDDRFVDVFTDIIAVTGTEFAFAFNEDKLDVSQSERLAPTEQLRTILGPPRKRGEEIDPRHAAIAYATQKTLEDVGCRLVENACDLLDTHNVVFSGGLALNCVMNEKVRARLGVEPFILPPCGDDGTALGAAILLRRDALRDAAGARRPRLRYAGSYGTKNDSDRTRIVLDDNGFVHEKTTPAALADMLAEDKVLGHISGRYEFGPRALGFRSILADPRPQANWPRVNETVKFREDFRPFAPIMLMEETDRFWGAESRPTESPYMLLAPVMNDDAREQLGAVTHRDGSARVQTVTPDFNPRLWEVLVEFRKRTGVGVLMNTSLNMSGESIIIDHEDLVAFMAFSALDAVVLDDILVRRAGNEDALTAFVAGTADRNAYLKRRRRAYEAKWGAAVEQSRYLDFFEFYEFLYGCTVD